METRANYALIGGVILAAFLSLFLLVVWMGQVQFSRNFVDYDVRFEGPVNGLTEGAAVRYLGLKVGEVERLEIDPANDSAVIARIRIDSKTPVRDDSTAILDFVGLTGATFIQIQAGTPGNPLLRARPGQPVPVIRTEPTQLASLVTGGQQIMSEAGLTLRKLNTLMSDENIAALSATLANAESLSAQLAQPDGLLGDLRGSVARMDAAVLEIGSAAGALRRFAEEADAEVEVVSADLSQAIQGFERDVTLLRESLVTTSKQIEALTRSVEVPTTGLLNDLRRTSQDVQAMVSRFDRLAREIEQNPQGFVVGQPLPVRREAGR